MLSAPVGVGLVHKPSVPTPSVSTSVGEPEGQFLIHARDQVTWRLLKKAEDAFAIENYYEVMKIAAMQYGFNLGALTVYYDLLKGDAYDRIQRLVGNALESGIPEKVRASACIAELKILSNYYKNHLACRTFILADVKK